MLHQDLGLLDAEPAGRSSRLIVTAMAVLVVLTGALMFLLASEPILASVFLVGLVVMLVAAFVLNRSGMGASEPLPVPVPDNDLVSRALDLIDEPAAWTRDDGSTRMANQGFRNAFGPLSSIGALAAASGGDDPDARSRLSKTLERLRADALRSGESAVEEVVLGLDKTAIRVLRVGAERNELLWRFTGSPEPDPLVLAADRVAGAMGERLANAGVMTALVDEGGLLIAANKIFASRALPRGSDIEGQIAFSDLLLASDDGLVRLASEGEQGAPLHLVPVPIDPNADGGAMTILMFDPHEGALAGGVGQLETLLDILPIGLALVDRDGRFLTMNKGFRVAAGIQSREMPSYPGDLVVKEDKGAVADTVRRHVRGPTTSYDLPVRLTINPKESVALTVAGLRSLGDAAVLLLLKDNSEEAKLKRQIAQATKMQAVGQLAGGVAHDFNNILTAIIGHCDLMLMRHTPGDSDYDDIQQIKSNSNRAAGLTRQLLAFSRQQTLRPQILQIPDVVSEVSHLLKRLLGETVQLSVKHGRDLGAVRADPGQLEQVIVNLAVNARDAMMTKGGGTLTIQTYAVRADQVADIGSDILPVADYSALSISDTGTGIPANVLGKVFEPFFTTKEVGKGTGLGLSTVYGIVKQSGGFIFADSKVGEGTRFTIYLPVHAVEAGDEGPAKVKAEANDKELWGTGTVLLVEDEPMVRTVAERALTRHGYKVLSATNGEEALDLLDKTDETISLLISDVVMPLMDGPTMVREARKTREELPILFMSGYAEEQLRNSIDLANVDFLPKPFSVQELAEAVRKVLAAHEADA